MDKANPPRSFGVFKPVGHTVIAFASAELMEAAANTLREGGFQASDLVRYTPAEMMAQADSDLGTASPMASVGQDLNIVKAYREMAEKSCSFLVVETSNSSSEQQVDEVVHAMKATAAQRFGTFVVEELVEAPDGRNQSFESPDTGLDIDTAPVAAPR